MHKNEKKAVPIIAVSYIRNPRSTKTGEGRQSFNINLVIKYQISGNKKTAAEQSAAVMLLVLCAGIFSAVLHRSQRKSFTDFVPNHFVSNFLLQTSYQRPTIFHHIGPIPRKQIRNRIEQTKPTFHHSGWVTYPEPK